MGGLRAFNIVNTSVINVTTKNCKFADNYGSAVRHVLAGLKSAYNSSFGGCVSWMFNATGNTTLMMSESVYQNCRAGSGGAIDIMFKDIVGTGPSGASASTFIQNCHFVNSTALQQSGGAVQMQFSSSLYDDQNVTSSEAFYTDITGTSFEGGLAHTRGGCIELLSEQLRSTTSVHVNIHNSNF